MKNNSNTPLCYIGIEGSPNCSIYWGPHKINRYKTESINEMELNEGEECKTSFGIMTEVFDEMMKELGIDIPYLEAPVKSDIKCERARKFFDSLDDLFKRE